MRTKELEFANSYQYASYVNMMRTNDGNEPLYSDDKEYSRGVIQKALNKSFAPEFLNRVDEIITFDQLSLDAIEKIIDIELKGLYERVESLGYKLLLMLKPRRSWHLKDMMCSLVPAR